MQRNPAYRWLAIAVFLLAGSGCQEPYFATQSDYVYFNEVNGQKRPHEPDDNPAIPPGLPRTVIDPAGREKFEVTLENVKQMALGQNPRIAFVAYQPGVVGTNIDTQLSTFDPFFEIGGGWSRTDQQTSSVLETGSFFGPGSFKQDAFGAPVGSGPYGYNLTNGAETSLFNPAIRQTDALTPGTNLVDLSKKNATGGISRVGYGLDYQLANPPGFNTVNPYWRSRLNFRLDQPLAQGAGVEFNRAPVLIARANHEQAIQNFDAEVRTLLRDIEVAYWQLYYSYQDLYSAETGLKLALVTWQKEKTKQEIGTASTPDVAQAREQYELFRATRNEALNRVLAAERDLRNLLGLPPDDSRQFIPHDEPVMAEYSPNWEVAVCEALERRPELTGQRLAIRAAELELFRQKNALKPDLTFSAAYEITGLDDQFDQSINQLKENNYQDWYLGIRYRRQVGERSANAGYRRAQLSLSQARAGLRSIEHSILHELHAAYQDLAFTHRQIQIQADRRLAASELLNAREQFYRQGRATVDILLEAQRAFSNALRDEALATAQYNQALVNWEYAKGSILENDNVIISEQSIDRADPKQIRERQWQLKHALGIPLVAGKRVHGAIENCPNGRASLYQTGFFRETTPGESPDFGKILEAIETFEAGKSDPNVENDAGEFKDPNDQQDELVPAPVPPPRMKKSTDSDEEMGSDGSDLSTAIPMLPAIRPSVAPGLSASSRERDGEGAESSMALGAAPTPPPRGLMGPAGMPPALPPREGEDSQFDDRSPASRVPAATTAIQDLQEIPVYPGRSQKGGAAIPSRSSPNKELGPFEQLGFFETSRSDFESAKGTWGSSKGAEPGANKPQEPGRLAFNLDYWSGARGFILLGLASFFLIFAALLGWMYWDFRRA